MQPFTLQEVGLQARIAAPIAACQVANFLVPVISLAVVGQLGALELAAASVATTLFTMSAKVGSQWRRHRLLHAAESAHSSAAQRSAAAHACEPPVTAAGCAVALIMHQS